MYRPFEAHSFFSLRYLSAISLKTTVLLTSSIFRFFFVVPCGRPPFLLIGTLEGVEVLSSLMASGEGQVTGVGEFELTEVLSSMMGTAGEALLSVEGLDRLEIEEEERPISTLAISFWSGTMKDGSTATFSLRLDFDDDGSFPADAGFSLSSFVIGCDLIWANLLKFPEIYFL